MYWDHLEEQQPSEGKQQQHSEGERVEHLESPNTRNWGLYYIYDDICIWLIPKRQIAITEMEWCIEENELILFQSTFHKARLTETEVSLVPSIPVRM